MLQAAARMVIHQRLFVPKHMSMPEWLCPASQRNPHLSPFLYSSLPLFKFKPVLHKASPVSRQRPLKGREIQPGPRVAYLRLYFPKLLQIRAKYSLPFMPWDGVGGRLLVKNKDSTEHVNFCMPLQKSSIPQIQCTRG